MEENNKWKKWLIIALGIVGLIILCITVYNGYKTASELTYYWYSK